MSIHALRALRPYRLAAALFLAATPVLAGTVPESFSAILDNSIYQEADLSNGAGEHLFSGNTAFFSARRALLAFDLTEADVPPGSTVTEVTLRLWCTKNSSFNPVPQDFSLHRLTADWGESSSDAGDPGGLGAPAAPGDATWTERFFAQGMPWASPGGDFVAGASATVSIGTCSEDMPTSVVFDSNSQLVADVQGWLDDPDSNFGWILIGNEATDTTSRRFSSREHHDPAQTPQLDVVFDVSDEVPATSSTGAALLVLLMATASALVLRHARATR